MGNALRTTDNLITCPDCQHRISKQARTCPSCGRAFASRSTTSKVLFAICMAGALAMAFAGVVAAMNQPGNESRAIVSGLVGAGVLVLIGMVTRVTRAV